MFLFFLLFTVYPFPPDFDYFDISNSPVELECFNADSFRVKYNNTEYYFQYNETVNISGSSRTNSISVTTTSPHQVKIRLIDIYLYMVSQVAFDVSANGNVDLLVEGDNFIKSEKEPAIHVPPSSFIHIHSDSNGTLEAVSSGLSAAIGGRINEFCGFIFIENIILNATTFSLYSLAGWGSSAIGGGGGDGEKIGKADNDTINILITNSTVNASSDPFLGAAAIGSGGNSLPSFLNITILDSNIIANSSIGAKSYDGHVFGEAIMSGPGIGFGGTNISKILDFSGEINIINSTILSKGGDLKGKLINEPIHAVSRSYFCGSGIGLGGTSMVNSSDLHISYRQNNNFKISIDGSKVHADGGSSTDSSSFGGAGIGCGASNNVYPTDEFCGNVFIHDSIVSASAGNGISGFGSSGIGAGGSLYQHLSIDQNLTLTKSEVYSSSQKFPLNETYALNVFIAKLDEGSNMLAESYSTPAIKCDDFVTVSSSNPVLYVNSFDMNNIEYVNKVCFVSNKNGKISHDNVILFNLSSTDVKSIVKTLHPSVTFFVVGIDKNENIINYFVDENGKNIFYFDDKGMVIEQLTLINNGTPTPTNGDKKIDKFISLSLIIPLCLFLLLSTTVIGVFIHVRISEREIVEDIIETNLVRYI